jgi:glycosyltransferase involved in cell wall biosynthesis
MSVNLEYKSSFSIIIPTFNSERTIRDCIQSVICQTFDKFEVLIVDGKSSDNTLNIINDFFDNRIKVISESDKGIYDAMNKGIKLAKCDWLYFLGSDDALYDDNVLNDVFVEINKHKVDVIYGNVLKKPSNRIYDGEFSYDKMQTSSLCHQAIFYNKIIFNDFGLYNIRYKILADHDMNLNWFFSNKHKNHFVDRIIAQYSESGISSYYKDKEFEEDFNEKLFRLSLTKFSFLKLKELALEIAIKKANNKENAKLIKYYIFYYIYRFLDLLNRKINN